MSIFKKIPMTYTFKGHVKIAKIYMVKFNVTVSNRPKIWGFERCKVKTYNNVICKKPVAKFFTILRKWVFWNLIPRICWNIFNCDVQAFDLR